MTKFTKLFAAKQPQLARELSSIPPDERELICHLNQIGAASAAELAVRTNRIGEDLTPKLQELAQKHLLKVRTFEHGHISTTIYQTEPQVRALLTSNGDSSFPIV